MSAFTNPTKNLTLVEELLKYVNNQKTQLSAQVAQTNAFLKKLEEAKRLENTSKTTSATVQVQEPVNNTSTSKSSSTVQVQEPVEVVVVNGQEISVNPEVANMTNRKILQTFLNSTNNSQITPENITLISSKISSHNNSIKNNKNFLNSVQQKINRLQKAKEETKVNKKGNNANEEEEENNNSKPVVNQRLEKLLKKKINNIINNKNLVTETSNISNENLNYILKNNTKNINGSKAKAQRIRSARNAIKKATQETLTTESEQTLTTPTIPPTALNSVVPTQVLGAATQGLGSNSGMGAATQDLGYLGSKTLGGAKKKRVTKKKSVKSSKRKSTKKSSKKKSTKKSSKRKSTKKSSRK